MPAARPALAVGGAALVVAAGLVLDSRGGPDHPDAWDPRVAALADFVEDERGLRFDHPVAVDFLTGEEYADRVRGGEPDDPDVLDTQAGVLRALGLAEGDLDLGATADDVADVGTLAFYDSAAERVTVRGQELTPDLRVTLVHELTHALQDQAYDLDELFEVGEQARSAVRGLIEGDAVRIEQRYVATLPPDEQAAYEEATSASVEQAEAGLADAPAAYLALFDAPYAFGSPFLTTLEAPGGPTVDDAFEGRLPTSEEQLTDPARYLAGDDPSDVEVPGRPDDDDLADEGTVGPIALFLLLAERIDPHEALAAVDGWDGDAYVAEGDDEDLCVTAAVATDGADDRDELHEALGRWTAAQPDASSRMDGDLVVVRACDPGPDADLGLTGQGADALVLPVIRSYLFADALLAFAPDDAACVADGALVPFDIAALADPEGAVFTDGTLAAAVQRAVLECGLG